MRIDNSDRSDSVAVVISAGGQGERLGANRPKALVELAGQSLLARAIGGAAVVPGVGLIVVAGPAGELDEVRDITEAAVEMGSEWRERPVEFAVVAGGASRRDSVQSALAVIPADYPIVLVHDAARALTPTEVFEVVIAAVVGGAQAAIPVLPVVDTIKRVQDDVVVETVDRAVLRSVQTPQGFRRDVLIAAHEAAGDDPSATDDAGLVEALDIEVRIVPGHRLAFKITTPFDLTVAQAIVTSLSGRPQ